MFLCLRMIFWIFWAIGINKNITIGQVRKLATNNSLFHCVLITIRDEFIQIIIPPNFLIFLIIPTNYLL
jgi:hypothetical protein